MSLTYFKRFRMEISLAGREFRPSPVSADYALLPWDPALLEDHAEAKYLSFREEVDSDVFPCLGDLSGCSRLMSEISRKDGFLPAATWLAVYTGDGPDRQEFCGTVQGIRDDTGYGSIQNLGITPQHRGRGLGKHLLYHSLDGFQRSGLERAFLEVTARNLSAIRLYETAGFAKVRTLYKAVEVACT